ncbi:hypothetical protein [Naasia aerilata]|uniref:Hemagglutinin n=1 Tax=Naasia aerilata TaxID=1162966 RepID=A0ABM8G7V2_9MICO|nr:hypothetical protein [Naasia aerilata]BDZ44166.1 hypothetical protein GCM10025866_00750 [Naasia aerilata]
MLREVGAAVLAMTTALSPAGPASGLSSGSAASGVGARVEWRLADADDFRPGMLISDDRFYDDRAMDAEAIQRFLERTPCLPEDGAPCLSDYREDTPDVPDVGVGHCGAYHGGAGQRAADILAEAGQACGMNPQVLLVLLQKEQSLVTRPSTDGYLRATGYACPDTADCDADYFGFFNQVYNAAWQFRQYTLYPSGRGFGVGTVEVAYSPDASCGAAPVRIRNQATANLYNYTPYQPNRAALASLYGDGDACSAFGNRNFWRIFTDWFGDPTAVLLPEWLGPCLAHEAGRPCLETYWVAPPPR